MSRNTVFLMAAMAAILGLATMGQAEPESEGQDRGPRRGPPPREGGDRWGGPPPPPSPEEIFSQIDADGDGMISQDEFTQHHEERMRRGRPPGPPRGPEGMGRGPRGGERGERGPRRQGPPGFGPPGFGPSDFGPPGPPPGEGFGERRGRPPCGEGPDAEGDRYGEFERGRPGPPPPPHWGPPPRGQRGERRGPPPRHREDDRPPLEAGEEPSLEEPTPADPSI